MKFGILYERQLLNLRFRDKRDMWEDAVRCTLPMFWNQGWEYEGEFFKFPLRAVVPKPLQGPHPPRRVACSRLDTIKCAAHRGMGSLWFKFVSLDAARGEPNKPSSKEARNMASGVTGRPAAQSIA